MWDVYEIVAEVERVQGGEGCSERCHRCPTPDEVFRKVEGGCPSQERGHKRVSVLGKLISARGNVTGE